MTTADPARDALTPEGIEADVATLRTAIGMHQGDWLPDEAEALTRLAAVARRGADVEAAVRRLEDDGMIYAELPDGYVVARGNYMDGVRRDRQRLARLERGPGADLVTDLEEAERRAAEMEAALRSVGNGIAARWALGEISSQDRDDLCGAIDRALNKEAGGR